MLFIMELQSVRMVRPIMTKVIAPVKFSLILFQGLISYLKPSSYRIWFLCQRGNCYKETPSWSFLLSFFSCLLIGILNFLII